MFRSISLIFLLSVLVLQSCQTIDLYEKNVSIPGHAWSSNFQPQFKFNITDTTVPYEIFISIRHNDQYSFNNIWINLLAQAPGDSVKKFQYELPLATRQGWTGVGMGDVYHHRIALPQSREINFSKSGEYVFTLEHIMRQDPLLHVLDVGLRLEKKIP